MIREACFKKRRTESGHGIIGHLLSGPRHRVCNGAGKSEGWSGTMGEPIMFSIAEGIRQSRPRRSVIRDPSTGIVEAGQRLPRLYFGFSLIARVH
jgi:hypothetical protein